VRHGRDVQKGAAQPGQDRCFGAEGAARRGQGRCFGAGGAALLDT
jgi:hypothetical protein